MELDSVYGFAAAPAATASLSGVSRSTTAHQAIDPPASRLVLEQLAALLTPPQSMAAAPSQARVGTRAYDNVAGQRAARLRQPDKATLWAYAACAEVIREHSKSFYFSARLLPKGKREGIMALYAFCRVSDDLVDNADAEVEKVISRVQARLALNSWARANSTTVPRTEHPVVVAWADSRRRFGIPQVLADELLDGVRMDLTIDRYDTWNDLWLYCYRVASTVGLMSMYVTGTETMDAVPYAVQLGVALQLTNILRDVGEDARAGRIYLPREDMARFGYTEEMLMHGTRNEEFVALMRFEIARARALYAAAEPGIGMLPADSRLAVSAASTLYRSILNKIEANNYDVFGCRAHLSAGEKMRALPGLWMQSKRLR